MVNHNPICVQRFEAIVNKPNFDVMCQTSKIEDTQILLNELKPLLNISATKSKIGQQKVVQTRLYMTNLIRFVLLPTLFLPLLSNPINRIRFVIYKRVCTTCCWPILLFVANIGFNSFNRIFVPVDPGCLTHCTKRASKSGLFTIASNRWFAYTVRSHVVNSIPNALYRSSLI